MSTYLRIVMIIVAVMVMLIIVRSVNKKRMRIQYSILWLLIAAAMLTVALFPQIAVWLCKLTGIQTPSNLIYLLGIIALLFITFYQTILISKQADRITRLTQVLSIEKYKNENSEK